MKIVKLTEEHKISCINLFSTTKYMGVELEQHHIGTTNNVQAQTSLLFSSFTETYMTNLKSFHAFGAYGDEDHNYKNMLGFIAFHEDVHEPAWHLTMSRNGGERSVLVDLLDHVIAYNENNGRLKFYTLMNERHSKVIRRYSWSEYNNERYDYFDEYVVPAKTRCLYQTAWELMFKRTLLPVDTVIRCSFLKQKYRLPLTIGGGVVNAEEQYTQLNLSDGLNIDNMEMVVNG